jgi:hypothetical protein
VLGTNTYNVLVGTFFVSSVSSTPDTFGSFELIAKASQGDIPPSRIFIVQFFRSKLPSETAAVIDQDGNIASIEKPFTDETRAFMQLLRQTKKVRFSHHLSWKLMPITRIP